MFKTVLLLVLVTAGVSADEPTSPPSPPQPSITAIPFPNPYNQDTRPASLSLKGIISQVNSTHLNVTVTNDGQTDLAILPWNSLFEDATEHLSLTVRPLLGWKALTPSAQAVHRIHQGNMAKDALMTLNSGSQWYKVFDVTEAFKVPFSGWYKISFRRNLLGREINCETCQQNDTFELYPINVSSNDLVCKLAASELELSRVQDQGDIFTRCPKNKVPVVKRAINGARWLAYDGITNNYKSIFQKFFGTNEDDNPQATSSILQTLFWINRYSYEPKNNTHDLTSDHLTFNCPPSNKSDHFSGCQRLGAIASYRYALRRITLCPLYFDLPTSLNCEEPRSDNPNLEEKNAVMLHELTHDHTFAPQDVNDTLGNPFSGHSCYEYNCAVEIASQQGSNPKPIVPAMNYELYVQAIRYQVHGRGGPRGWSCDPEAMTLNNSPVISGNQTSPSVLSVIPSGTAPASSSRTPTPIPVTTITIFSSSTAPASSSKTSSSKTTSLKTTSSLSSSAVPPQTSPANPWSPLESLISAILSHYPTGYPSPKGFPTPTAIPSATASTPSSATTPSARVNKPWDNALRLYSGLMSHDAVNSLRPKPLGPHPTMVVDPSSGATPSGNVPRISLGIKVLLALLVTMSALV